MADRVSIEDLLAASDWLGSYEVDPVDSGDRARAEALKRVADWLDSEARKRVQRSQVRAVQGLVEHNTGTRPSAAQTRRALKRARTEGED